jgi:hypothetical protein
MWLLLCIVGAMVMGVADLFTSISRLFSSLT